MRNTLVDVHNLLMEQLERLNAIDVEKEEYQAEIQRSEAMVKVSGAITENANIILKGVKTQYDIGNATTVNPILLGEGKND